jgi:hypothetical protein
VWVNWSGKPEPDGDEQRQWFAPHYLSNALYVNKSGDLFKWGGKFVAFGNSNFPQLEIGCLWQLKLSTA